MCLDFPTATGRLPPRSVPGPLVTQPRPTLTNWFLPWGRARAELATSKRVGLGVPGRRWWGDLDGNDPTGGRREEKGTRVSHTAEGCVTLPRCQGDGCPTTSLQPPRGQHVPRGTACVQGSRPPKEGQSRAGFTPADSSALNSWGLAPFQGFYSAAGENKPSGQPQNSPPASWFLFCNQFNPKNVAVGMFPPSQPACEWVSGTGNSSYSRKRRQELSLGPGKGPVGSLASQVPGQRGGGWAAACAGWGQ